MTGTQNRAVTTPDSATGQGRQLLSGWRLAVIVIATSTVLGIAHQFQPMSTTADRPSRTTENAGPDLTISDAVISSFEASGRLRYRLLSPQIEHFQSHDRTYLRKPDLIISRDPDPPWQITAARGIVSNSSGQDDAEEVVELEEDVHMEQSFADGRNYLLVTPAITIFPKRQYAETKRDVMITTHAGRTRAVGLEGNLDQGLLKLFSDDAQRVHTVILADQFK